MPHLGGCVQEGVTNAIRHGKAGSVRVEIFEKRRTRAECKFKTGPALHLTIQDDGHGIGADTPAGFGLTVMRERIHALGGSFIIESAPARGTTLLIIFPIQNRTAEGSKLREGTSIMTQVLVIDDHPIVLEGCRQLLKFAGERESIWERGVLGNVDRGGTPSGATRLCASRDRYLLWQMRLAFGSGPGRPSSSASTAASAAPG